MPKIPPLYQQQRQTMGDHTQWQDKQQGSQRQQNLHVQNLSMRPGLNAGNRHRQNATHAMVQLISILSAAQVSASNPAITLQKEKGFLSKNNAYNSTTYSRASVTQLPHRHRHHHSMTEHSDTSRLIGAPSNYLPAVKLLPDVNSTQSDYIEGPVSKLIGASNSSLGESSQSINSAIDLVNLSPLKRQEIIFKEQTHHLSGLLEKNGYAAYKLRPLSRINIMVKYLSKGGKIAQEKVVRALLTPLNEYGSARGEFISAERQMGVIAGYLNQAILGMPLYEWMAQKIQSVRQYDLSWFNNKYLNRRINTVLRYFPTDDKLSHIARIYYQNNVLKKLLPTLALLIDEKERKQLDKINIFQPRWGIIHAGATLLNELNGLDGATLEEIEDVGMTLHAMLCEGAIPGEFINYFTLPALIYYARHIGEWDLSMLSETQMQVVYFRYFRYTKQLQMRNNPTTLLFDLLNSWHTRTALANQTLATHGVSEDYVYSYLNNHDTTIYQFKDRRVTLPNIDTVFEEQNRKLAEIFCEADKILLPLTFNALSADTRQFIAQAKVERVTVEFNAKASWKSRLPPRIDAYNGMPAYRIPDQVDLLQCTQNGTERIYALCHLPDQGSYTIKRVDRDRQALLSLLDKRYISSENRDHSPSRNLDYRPQVTGRYLLKEPGQTPQIFIETLADYHKNKLLKALDELGYDKTTQEKIKDFLLGLIPFYTCATESAKGDMGEALPACALDVIGLIPFIGRGAVTGVRFGKALMGSTVMAIQYGARQSTIKAALKQTGKSMVTHFASVTQEISPRVLRRLGIEFARGMDPGFELLASGGIKGIQAIQNIFSKIPSKSLGLTRLSEALVKNSVRLTPDPVIKNLHVKSIFSQALGRNLDVAVAGDVGGLSIWVQVDRQTGEFFGQKFVRDEVGSLEEIHVKLKHKGPKKKEMIYDKQNDCYKYRIKRGANLGKLCPGSNRRYESRGQVKTGSSDNMPVIGEGSVSVVYDRGDGYVIKKYKGKIDDNHKSRLQAAINNAKGFNRYYGSLSATVRVDQNADLTASVSVLLRKVEGIPLSSLHEMADKDLIIEIASVINRNDPSEALASKLRDKGIVHNDINKGNIIYSKKNGFSIIDFDSGYFLPEGEIAALSQTESMRKKFSHVFSDTMRDINTFLKNLER